MNKWITTAQMSELYKLGYNREELEYRKYNKVSETVSSYSKWFYPNGLHLFVPNVDEAIDWLRRKFKIMIYDATQPYVNPVINKIQYSYKVKKCSLQWGYNGREHVGQSRWSNDSYAAKRQAIWIAIRYIKKQKNAEARGKNKGRRKNVRSSAIIKSL